MNLCRVSRRRLGVHVGTRCLVWVTLLLSFAAAARIAYGLVDCYNLTNPSVSSNLLSNPSFDTSCLDIGWRRKKLNASCDPWPYLFPWRALGPGETVIGDCELVTATGSGNSGKRSAQAVARAAGTAGWTARGVASLADVTIADGVVGFTDTLLAADGSRFLRLDSAFSAASSAAGAGSSSESDGPGVSQALCALKPAPTANASQQAQQSPRLLSLSFFARASQCAEGEGEGEGEERRLLRVLLVAVPLNASAAAAGGGGAGAQAAEQVLGEWRVGVPCGGRSASVSGALPWFQVGPLRFALPDPPSSSSSPSSLVVPAGGFALHLVIRGVQTSSSSSTATIRSISSSSATVTATSTASASSSSDSSNGDSSRTTSASTTSSSAVDSRPSRGITTTASSLGLLIRSAPQPLAHAASALGRLRFPTLNLPGLRAFGRRHFRSYGLERATAATAVTAATAAARAVQAAAGIAAANAVPVSQTATVAAEGQSATVAAEGQSATVAAEGQSATVAAEGQSATVAAEGQSATVAAEGQSATVAAEGQSATVAAEGQSATVAAEGQSATAAAEGQSATAAAEGQSATAAAEGQSATAAAEGQSATAAAEGQSATVAAEGQSATAAAEGQSATAAAEGQSATAAAGEEGVRARTAAAFTLAASTGGAGGAKKVVPRRVGVASEAGSTAIDLASVVPTQTDPSTVKSFCFWPIKTTHPLLTAGSARRSPSSLALTALSDVNSAALALHPAPFALLAPATPASPCRPFSFATSFAFRISSPNAAGLGAHGMAFVMLPEPTLGLPGPSLGYGRVLVPAGRVSSTSDANVSSVASSQHSLAVEFDTSGSPEFFDRPDHHVGVNVDFSLVSLASASVHPVGLPALNSGQTLLASILYNASSSQLSVWLSPASSSSPPSPALPRSAVLSTFLDTCEWLGGNDPNAEAPPPPLFVGFTAGTGQGAEQAQAHEVLGWRFQVGEAVDPLPFWAADSFSIPYITPATPLLTRGSTRKRFFAADLSVAADVASASQSNEPAPGAIFFPRRLPLLYSSASSPFPPPPPPPPTRRRTSLPSPSSPPPQATPTAPPVCMARSFTFTYGFAMNVSATQGLAFVISTHASLGQGGAYMGYGRDPSSRLANGSWPDGARSVAVEWDTVANPETGDMNGIHMGINTDFNMTSIFAKKVLYVMDPDEAWQMRVDYNGSTKELAIRWYFPPVLRGSMKLTIDLCAALTGAAADGGGSSSSGSGDSSSGSSSSSAPDLSSPSFGHLFVGFTSAALPAAAGRLLGLVSLTSWTFRFTDTDPCKGSPVLPCGMGVCSKVPSQWDPSLLVPSCKCPLKLPTFEPSHLTRLPSCFPEAYTCRQLPRNPCAPGVCIDDGDGSYSCLCPSPYFPFSFTSKGPDRCSLLRGNAVRMPTFLSPHGLTCPLILNTYGLTQNDFLGQNRGFQCRAPIPVGTPINVTSRAFSNCTSMYTANYGDTCDSINALFSTQIEPLNPALSCSDGPRHGQLLCIDFDQAWLDTGKVNVNCDHYAYITPTLTPPGAQQPFPYSSGGALISVLPSPQSCQALWQTFSIASPTRFFQLNPGFSCDSLLPYSPLQGNFNAKVCMAGTDTRPLSGLTCTTRRTYSVRRGDTCGVVIAKRYRRSTDLFRNLNNGYDCSVNSLWAGMLLCLP
ncbi:hypothetical protein CLOM_g17742 [Closterium sp. NIES-68]|nr:hypothetical protein CLOM_g17742 [Closterium sp. NIES-68]GJP83548.1 hypothetical protein CLOP_g13686 [Closterium sp. NIES-67]